MNLPDFLEAVVRWAGDRPDVVVAALVGSHARGGATDASDVDLVILTPDAAKYVAHPAWLARFGEVARHEVEDWGRLVSVRAFYADGLEVEYGFAAPDWAGVPTDAGTVRVVSDGMRILYDPRASSPPCGGRHRHPRG